MWRAIPSTATGRRSRSCPRFNVQNLPGQVEKATLRLFANSASAGHDVHSVADNSWSESSLSFSNAPSFSEGAFGTALGVTAGNWTTVDVTPLVTGEGNVSFALDTLDSTSVNYSSREGANPPQLVIESSVPGEGNNPPTASDTSLTTDEETQGTWT